MEKKYYATQMDGELFDWEAYLDEEALGYCEVWVGGNRDFIELNYDLISDARTLISDATYDIETCWDDYDEEEGNEDEVYEAQLEVIKDYTKITDRTKQEKLLDVLEDYRHAYVTNHYDELKVVCKILSIVKDKEFKIDTLHGYSQSDWIYCIYPEETSYEYLKYVEAVFFGTGTEFQITTEKCTKEELENEEVDVYHDYTVLYGTEKIKDWLAASIGCSRDEIVLRTIKSSYVVRHFEYEED